MVPETARIKLTERVAMANRLGDEFRAEALGMLDVLYAVGDRSDRYPAPHERASYLRGYRDAQEIIAVEATLAARVAKAV